MTSKTLAELLIDLGVAQSHSRPTISDDNPYSESQFKTMKYGPTYPDRFASIAAARAWMRWFADWYNHAHKQSGIGLLPPAVVYGGQAPEVIAKRQAALDAAYVTHPERFPRGRPIVPQLPTQVGINLPQPSAVAPTAATPAPLPTATPESRVSAAQRPLDSGAVGGQPAPEVPVVDRPRGASAAALARGRAVDYCGCNDCSTAQSRVLNDPVFVLVEGVAEDGEGRRPKAHEDPEALGVRRVVTTPYAPDRNTEHDRRQRCAVDHT